MSELNKDTIAMIIQKVLNEIKSAPIKKKILAIFCGGKIGAEEGLAELGKLDSSAYDLTVILTPAAEQILGVNWLRSGLGNIPVITKDSSTTAPEVLRDADIIVVPVLTRNSAAKIAHGIADNMATNLISMGLLNGIPIIAAREACDVENPMFRKIFPTINNNYYKNIFNENLNILENIGINMTSVLTLAEAVSNESNGRKSNGAETVIYDESGSKSSIFKGRILTAAELSLFTGSLLRVSDKTLITPAAKDIAHERGIEIAYN